MSFPLWYLLIPYALVVFGTGVFLFFSVYHVVKFGLQSTSSSVLIGMYGMSYFVVLVASLVFLAGYDWTSVVELGDILPSVPSFGL